MENVADLGHGPAKKQLALDVDLYPESFTQSWCIYLHILTADVTACDECNMTFRNWHFHTKSMQCRFL